MLESLRTAPRILLRKITANHAEEEERDRKEQRLKLKIGSPFINPKLVRISDKTLMKKIVNPKSSPTISPLKEGNDGRIANIPPSKHAPNSNRAIILPDGKANSDE